MEEIPDNTEFLIGSGFGVYIPQMFAATFRSQLSQQQADDLSDPNNDFYWETWDDVLNKTFTIRGKSYTLWQPEDLWAIPTPE